MSYADLTINERTKIETLFQLGLRARHIAVQIKRHHSPVSRELHRYEATDTQKDYQHKRMYEK